MSLGIRFQLNPINAGDTAEIYTFLSEREGIVPQEDIAQVAFIIQQPNGTFAGYPPTMKTLEGTLHKGEPEKEPNKGLEVTGISSTAGIVAGKTLIRGGHLILGTVVTKVVDEHTVLIDKEPSNKMKEQEETVSLEVEGIEWPGEVEDDGQGYLQWTKTEEPGEYLVQSTFTLVTQEIRSVMANFAVINPFVVPPPTPNQLVAEEVGLRFEDAFDSVEGGPILRDYTLAHFDLKKIEKFIPEALLDLNVQMPPTEYDVKFFASIQENGEVNPLMPLLSKGVTCKVLLHMIRSYTEQPIPQGAQVTYEERAHYAKAWMSVYQTEREDWISMVRLWKRQGLLLGHSSLLVASKAGRLFYSGTWRTQNVGRAFF